MLRQLVDLYLNRTYTNSNAISSVQTRTHGVKMKQAATLTEAQLQQVLRYCDGTRAPLRNQTILLLTHWAGMRIGEVAALRWSDVIAADGSIRTEIRLTANQTKGNRAAVVLIPQRLQRALAVYAASVPVRKPNSPLFPTQRSAGFTANTLTHIVNSLYRGAGIHGATSHSGRRTYITNLAERGVSARVLMSLCRHRNLSTTQRYIDIKPSMLRAAVELV
jgi:integrase/recombinase XerD